MNVLIFEIGAIHLRTLDSQGNALDFYRSNFGVAPKGAGGKSSSLQMLKAWHQDGQLGFEHLYELAEYLSIGYRLPLGVFE